jgi:hypothetical protein
MHERDQKGPFQSPVEADEYVLEIFGMVPALVDELPLS